MARKQIDTDEELEEFEDEEEEEEEPDEDEEEGPTLPKLVPKKKPESKPMPRMIVTEPEGDEEAEEHFKKAVRQQEEEKKQPEIQYVPVPRAVPMESLLNEIYDRQEQIISMLNELLKNER